MTQRDGLVRPIHGVAVDAGSGLEATLRDARGSQSRSTDLKTFKRHVLMALGPSATTVLVDAHYGPDLLADYPAGCAPMLAFEADVYQISDADRMTVLPKNLRVADYSELGVRLLKFFMYYAPDDQPDINQRKQDCVARIGEACEAHGLQFLMEPLIYAPDSSPGSAEFALQKPDLVRRATETFADRRFKASVLKVEVPVDLAFVTGFGDGVMSRDQALDAFGSAAEAAGDVPLVYLSAGVPFDWFQASLEMALEAGVDFAGFMCGRAIWSDAIEYFGHAGEDGLRDWLSSIGRSRLLQLISALKEPAASG